MTVAHPAQPGPISRAELEGRFERLRAGMRVAGLDGVVLTGEANLRWASGWAPRIYPSPTRPWFAVLPLEGDPQLVLPEMGLAEVQRDSWISRIECWPSPRPGDEGVSLLAQVLLALPRRFGAVGFELGPETRLGMPVADFLAVQARLAPVFQIADAGGLLQALRARKSPAEVGLVRAAVDAAQAAFDALPSLARVGTDERTLCRRFQARALEAGADRVPYVALASGPGGYDSIVRGPGAHLLAPGDVLGVDTGTVVGGYWADFNRNYALGPAPEAEHAHRLLWRALEAGLAAAKSGAAASEVWHAMAALLPDAGNAGVGRMGHGIGLDYTEPPSIHPGDATVLAEGMVLAIEPGFSFAASDGTPRFMALEEDVWLTADGPVLLTRRASEMLPVLPALLATRPKPGRLGDGLCL